MNLHHGDKACSAHIVWQADVEGSTEDEIKKQQKDDIYVFFVGV